MKMPELRCFAWARVVVGGAEDAVNWSADNNAKESFDLAGAVAVELAQRERMQLGDCRQLDAV